MQTLHNRPSGLKIKSKIEYGDTVHFDVFESSDLLALTDESHKIVNFYSLQDILKLKKAVDPTSLQPLYRHRNFKKVTDLKRVTFGNVEGLLISDKMGEIGFINIKNVDKLP